MTRVGKSLIGFSSNSLVFESNSLESRANHSCRSFVKSDESDSHMSLLFPEQPERIAHGRSFVKSDESDLLTVALLS